MPRFFFNISDGGVEQADTIGTDLPNAKAARGEAIRAAGEMLADIDGALTEDGWRMTVTDEGGKVVLRLQFSAIEQAQS